MSKAGSILVNNAGIVGSYQGIETVSLEDYNRIIAINQTGVFLGMRHCAPLMRKDGAGLSSTSRVSGASLALATSRHIRRAKARLLS